MNYSFTEYFMDENCKILEKSMGKNALKKNKERRKSLKFTSPHASQVEDCKQKKDMRIRYGSPPKFCLKTASIEDDLDLPSPPGLPKLMLPEPLDLSSEDEADWSAMLIERRKILGKSIATNCSTPVLPITPPKLVSPTLATAAFHEWQVGNSKYPLTPPASPPSSSTSLIKPQMQYTKQSQSYNTPPTTPTKFVRQHYQALSISKIPVPCAPTTPIKTAGAWHRRQVSANETYKLPAEVSDLEKAWGNMRIQGFGDDNW
ncbi:hypothetical protein CC86DRAFT_379659 [Ophiobolus disseminans]|uniref:Uncharacterized protein n=1 Tax=Ophiobolus disseminans TaxID=1469910 RepID=A0A6A7AC95_9PLEO|nr:hypothetical protein CC86DRAFT_379659 [Ophiobolus disseminans]